MGGLWGYLGEVVLGIRYLEETGRTCWELGQRASIPSGSRPDGGGPEVSSTGTKQKAEIMDTTWGALELAVETMQKHESGEFLEVSEQIWPETWRGEINSSLLKSGRLPLSECRECVRAWSSAQVVNGHCPLQF